MAEYIGNTVCYIGGWMLALMIIGFLAYLVGVVWVEASNKWRAICRAESLIFEYRKNRNDFMYWLNMQKGENNG